MWLVQKNKNWCVFSLAVSALDWDTRLHTRFPTRLVIYSRLLDYGTYNLVLTRLILKYSKF